MHSNTVIMTQCWGWREYRENTENSSTCWVPGVEPNALLMGMDAAFNTGFVNPNLEVTDYRTQCSGVGENDL